MLVALTHRYPALTPRCVLSLLVPVLEIAIRRHVLAVRPGDVRQRRFPTQRTAAMLLPLSVAQGSYFPFEQCQLTNFLHFPFRPFLIALGSVLSSFLCIISCNVRRSTGPTPSGSCLTLVGVADARSSGSTVLAFSASRSASRLAAASAASCAALVMMSGVSTGLTPGCSRLTLTGVADARSGRVSVLSSPLPVLFRAWQRPQRPLAQHCLRCPALQNRLHLPRQ